MGLEHILLNNSLIYNLKKYVALWSGSLFVLVSSVRGGLDLLTRYTIHLMVIFILSGCRPPAPV